MKSNNGRGRACIRCLAILIMVGVEPAAYLQRSTRKAAPLPKYNREWTAVVQKMVLALNANGMMKIGKRVGLEITKLRNYHRESRGSPIKLVR